MMAPILFYGDLHLAREGRTKSLHHPFTCRQMGRIPEPSFQHAAFRNSHCSALSCPIT